MTTEQRAQRDIARKDEVNVQDGLLDKWCLLLANNRSLASGHLDLLSPIQSVSYC